MSKNILGLERWGWIHPLPRMVEQGLPGLVKWGVCCSVTHIIHLLMTVQKAWKTDHRKRMVVCSVSLHADSGRCRVAAKGQIENLLALGILREVLCICSLWQERLPTLTHSGAGWGPCKHQTHHLSTVVPSVPGEVCWEQSKHRLCHLFVEITLKYHCHNLRTMHSLNICQRKD